mmetsp:Transcript_4178/g.12035  ORF Transcript_4178/g.12035 Transcript_4178/m.12035 type:complete len:201 (-) Transcript_4178:1006-1608(-)
MSLEVTLGMHRRQSSSHRRSMLPWGSLVTLLHAGHRPYCAGVSGCTTRVCMRYSCSEPNAFPQHSNTADPLAPPSSCLHTAHGTGAEWRRRSRRNRWPDTSASNAAYCTCSALSRSAAQFERWCALDSDRCMSCCVRLPSPSFRRPSRAAQCCRSKNDPNAGQPKPNDACALASSAAAHPWPTMTREGSDSADRMHAGSA